MASAAAVARLFLAAATAILAWPHRKLVRPLVEWWEETVLGNWEESLIVFVRESFVQITRALGACARWILSVIDPAAAWYGKESARTAWQHPHSWQERWVNPPLSTLNQILHNSRRSSLDSPQPRTPSAATAAAIAAAAGASPAAAAAAAAPAATPAGKGPSALQMARSALLPVSGPRPLARKTTVASKSHAAIHDAFEEPAGA